MKGVGRLVLVAMVAICVGFVGGAWFIGSGVAFQTFPIPEVPPASEPRKPARRAGPAPAPRTKPVAVPRLANFDGGSAGLEPRAERFDLLPTAGGVWEIEPRLFRPGLPWQKTDAERTVAGDPTTDSLGGLRFLLIQSTRPGSAAVELRPIFFDEEGHRFVPGSPGKTSHSGRDGAFLMNEFHLDPIRRVAAAKVVYFGVERMPPDSARRVAEAARKEAEANGIAIPPPPRPGQPYGFDLPAADGRRARLDDFRGKVVVVAFVEPGPINGMSLMMLAALRRDYKPEEVAFVVITFDGAAEDARRDIERGKVDATLVVVPNDPTIRRVWCEGAEIEHVPMLLLLDREGVLLARCSPFQLKGRVDALFGRVKPRRLPKPVYGGQPAGKPDAPPAPPGDAPIPESSPSKPPGA